MGFNIQTFKTRTLTAIVFVAVMMAGLLWNRWSFFILFSIVHFGCWIEYQRLVNKIDPDYKTISSLHKYAVMLAGWCMLFYCTNAKLQIGSLRLNELGWWIGLGLAFILPLTDILVKKVFLLRI